MTINAPRQILVQGRGLDAELGGSVHIGGTLDAPLVSGGFDLQRGTLSIGGSRLNLQTVPPGRVSFDGAGLKRTIDPTLDFTAESKVASTGTDVTLHISGHADSPKIDFEQLHGSGHVARRTHGAAAIRQARLAAHRLRIGARSATRSPT